MTESKWPLLTVAEAQQLVLAHTPALPPVRCPLTDALGCVLAEDVCATEDVPPFACSSVDGYAVVAADTQPARRLAGSQMAGGVSGLRVEPGTAVRITTGAPIPPGADAVVMVEHTGEAAGQVVLRAQPAAGDNVCTPGQDIARGQRILARGTRLTRSELGVVAAIGQAEVTVHRRPRVAVLSTGDEIVEPGRPLRPGQIHDSNRFTLMAAVEQTGCRVLDLGMAHDTPGEIAAAVRRGLEQADALITSGGVSMGQLDLVKPLLAQLGQVHFGRVYAKPGMPVTFATIGSQPAFALPGSPVAVLICYDLLVRPALMQMRGRAGWRLPRRWVVLRQALHRAEARAEFRRAVVTYEDGVYVATVEGQHRFHHLLSMVGANALLELKAGQGDYPAGYVVEAYLIDEVDGAEG